MKLVLHRRVRSDVDEIMDYYKQAEQPELAEDFYRELRAFLLEAGDGPTSNLGFGDSRGRGLTPQQA